MQRCLLIATIGIALSLSGCHLGATPSYTDRPELSPLMNAAWHNDLPRVSLLIKHGANVHESTREGQTPLYFAIERSLGSDNLGTVDALLKAGADPDEAEFVLGHPLEVSLARDYANPAVTLLLLDAGAKVTRACGEGDSLLSLATQDSSTEVMRALIARGAPLNCQDKPGITALYWAAINGEADRVSLLIESGADPAIPTNDGRTLLEAATATNPDPRVQAKFLETRKLLRDAISSRSHF